MPKEYFCNVKDTKLVRRTEQDYGPLGRDAV